MKKVVGKLGGRKFVVAVVSLLLVVLSATTSLDLTQHKELIIGIVGTYLLGQGIADGLSKGATSTTTED